MSELVNPEIWQISQGFSNIDDSQLTLLQSYLADIRKWNPKVNLISAGTLESVERVHLADCILGIRLFEGLIVSGRRVFDFGSGNGFPGVVLAILRSDI